MFIFVSTEAAATVMVPVTSPPGETVPDPLTVRKAPFTGTRPQTLFDRSPTVDREGSSVQVPASAASCSSACACEVVCPDGAMPSTLSVWFVYQNSFVTRTVYTALSGCQGEAT